MTPSEQCLHLRNEITKVIDRFAAEYDLPLAAAMGVLEIVKIEIHDRSKNEDTDSDAPA